MDTRATLIRKEVWERGSDLAKISRLKNIDRGRLYQYVGGHLKEAPEIEKALLEFGISKQAIEETRKLYRQKHPTKSVNATR